ncbi:hypothetical protein NB231_11914 [Nitrococcus mobilis Nb-231]|uniref:DUF481 domain-containing protein n=2 Tax=Nitrococcus mobilis TaxID=35797 RepID=A4BPE0_9GAMM|nr:hypothetical protein NB231_11914 [Nitrococcus mobilis Nb-231]
MIRQAEFIQMNKNPLLHSRSHLMTVSPLVSECQRGLRVVLTAAQLAFRELPAPWRAQRPEPSRVMAAVMATGFLVLFLCRVAMSENSKTKGPWAPPEPSHIEYDWIQLDSGEWLKGDLERLRDRKVDFDSDKLNDLAVDFSDVARFHLPRPHAYRLENHAVYRGVAEMRDGLVRVRTTSEIVEFHRDELVSIVQGKGRERDRWSTQLSTGFATRQGNTNQVDLTALLNVRRETALTRLSFDYNGLLTSVNDERAANSHRASTSLDVYLTKRLFLTVPSFEFFSDQFQNIAQRYTPGAGLGYEFVRRPWVDWDVKTGAAYQYTKFVSGEVAKNIAVIASTEFDFDFDVFDWDNLYRIQIVATDLGMTSHHFESVVSFDIWGPIDFDVAFIWDRIMRPEPDSDGVRPKSDDTRLSVGLGLDL